jgi:hypothetical protein
VSSYLNISVPTHISAYIHKYVHMYTYLNTEIYVCIKRLLVQNIYKINRHSTSLVN